MSKFANILKKLNINEEFTRPIRKEKKFAKVKQNIPHEQFYNYMADLLFLPTTKEGFKYCLVVVDLATNQFDIEPIKNKEPKTILEAFQKMFNRKYIKKPFASVATDAGTEFMGIFHKWLYDQSIYHKIASPNRHQQMSNVESLNKQLGRLFNGYMNSIELQTAKPYREWTKAIPVIREELNKYRKIDVGDSIKDKYKVPPTASKYKVGDIVHVRLDSPENALGQKQPTNNFRVGDFRISKVPRKIENIVYYDSGARYIIQGIPNVSYTESELLKSKEKEEKWVIQKIVKKVMKGKNTFYEVKWKNYKATTLEPRKTLLEDIPIMLKEFEIKNN